MCCSDYVCRSRGWAPPERKTSLGIAQENLARALREMEVAEWRVTEARERVQHYQENAG